MLARLIIALIALAYTANGTHMLADPAGWHAAVPGVVASGPLNSHFVRDIGFAYLLSGIAGAMALRDWTRAQPWLLAAVAWPAAHAGLHCIEWAMHSVPGGAAFVAEGLGVIVPALLGLAVTVARMRDARPA